MYKNLGYILVFLFLFISVLQSLFFYDTYRLNRQQLNTRLQKALTQIEQIIEQHEINRHKSLFEQYRQQYLCIPAKDSFMDITFRIYATDTFNNLQDLSETINRKLSKQAINSSKYMIKQLPIDTAFIDAIVLNYLVNNFDQNLQITYSLNHLAPVNQQKSAFLVKLFDDYRFYAPVYLNIDISGLNGVLFHQLLYILISCIALLILYFIVTRYTYLTLVKYKQLADSKTEFISHLAHEIKTPLTSIYISSQALKDNRIIKDETAVNTYANAIYAESEKLQHQLENVLNVSASERQFLMLNKVRTNPNDLVLTITRLFQNRINDMHGSLNIHLNAPKKSILIDPIHIGNVLYNLIDNAIKYSRTKEVCIDIETTSVSDNFILSVTDKGIGIPTPNQGKVFNMFYKAHANISGFGVGLHYVKLIVEAHGGHINLSSKLTIGTTFTISIPYSYDE